MLSLLGALQETGAEQSDAHAEHHAAYPLGECPLLLHFRLEIPELEDTLLAGVVGRAKDQEDACCNEHQAGEEGGFHDRSVSARPATAT